MKRYSLPLFYLTLSLVAVHSGTAQTWLQLLPSNPIQPARSAGIAVYAPTSNKLIVFGGFIGGIPPNRFTNDLWILSGANGTGTPSWQQVIPQGATGSPVPREQSGGVYDQSSNRMILFGGDSDSGLYNDTWVLVNADGTTGTPSWLQLFPNNPPPKISRHTAVYDPSTNRLIVFGGTTLFGVTSNDTWVLTNANGTEPTTPAWTKLSPTGALPSPRSHHMAAYDATLNKMVIYGGELQVDTWVLGNANGMGGSPAWNLLSTGGPIPIQSANALAGYDSQSQRFILVAGSTGTGSTNAASVLVNALGNGPSVWQTLTPSGILPAPRDFPSGGYDQAHNTLIVFGGQDIGPSGQPVLNDTWVLTSANGLNGSSLTLSGVAPSHGGNAGTVTATLTGTGFQPGIQVKLTGIGPDIVGTDSQVLDAGFLTTTFDLTAATSGLRSVVVTNPDGTAATFTNEFTVEEGGEPDISVDIIGRDKIRIGLAQVYYATLNNRGNVDSAAGLLSLSIPAAVGFTQMNGTGLFVAGSTTGSEYDLPGPNGTLPAQQRMSLLFASPGVPAGASQLAPVELTLPFNVGISQFTVTSAWQADLLSLNFDDYLLARGVPYIPFQSACAQCYTQAVSQVNAITDAQTAYTAYQNAERDKQFAVAKLGVALGQAIFDLAFPLKRAVAQVTDPAFALLATDLLSQASNASAVLAGDSAASVLQRLGIANLALIGKATALLPGVPEALGKLLTNVISTLVALNSVLLSANSYVDAVNTAEAARAKFFPLFDKYQAARLAYRSCLNQSCVAPPPPPPIPPLPGPPITLPISGVGSRDPNDKIGPHGIGSARFISTQAPVGYSIFFDNQPTASAPAQGVTVTDNIDGNLDLTTVAPGPITLPSQLVLPPSTALSRSPFTTTVDLRPGANLLVKITAALNAATAALSWTFQSLDPSTGLPPTDPLAGFLPPGAEGSVFFTAMPKADLTTSTVIQNTATVVFDANPAINTPTWSNTIDNTKPVSQVSPLPSTGTSFGFPVQWSGTDVGSGVQDFVIYVSDNGGPFTPWLTNTTATQSLYNGVGGHTYAFYSLARDLVGNVESGKTVAEATTQILIDITPPVIVPQITGTLGNNGWYTSNVTVNWSVSDPESGIASSSGCGPTTLTMDTVGVSLGCTATNGAGLTTSVPLTIKIDKTPPMVAQFRVLFGSQSYNLIGSTRNRLPWQITGIQVVFTKPMVTGSTASLTGVSATGVTGLGTDTVTWTFNPMAIGSFGTTLAGTGSNALTDVAGNALGGGAGFSQPVRVLQGDFNDDGGVSSADLVGVNAATKSPYNIFADINGDGAVNASDVLIVRSNIGKTLP